MNSTYQHHTGPASARRAHRLQDAMLLLLALAVGVLCLVALQT